MFHSWPCPRVRLGGTVLSRFRARAFPWLLCRTGFAASMPRPRFRPCGRRLCAVKVKLTMSLADRRAAASVRALQLAGFLQVAGEVGTQAASNSLVIARGGVGMSPGPGAERSARRGRVFSAPSLFFALARLRPTQCLRRTAKPPIWAAIARVSRSLQVKDPFETLRNPRHELPPDTARASRS